MGKKEKIPPPPLLTNTTVTGKELELVDGAERA
jgi:hypothetical protein